jgi:hypothetical protein
MSKGDEAGTEVAPTIARTRAIEQGGSPRMTVRTLRTKVMAVAVTAASLLAIAAAPASAGAPAPSATVYVVHGIPGQRVDVCIAGLGEIASRLPYATRIRQELDPGTYSMKVRKVSRGACKGDVITKTALNLVDQDNVTAVIRIDAGQPAVTKFDNDVSATAVGNIRLTAAHMMKGGPVDVWANGVVEISNLVRGTDDAVALPDDDVYSVWASLVGESSPVVGPRVIDNTSEGQAFTFVMVGTSVSNSRVVVFKQDVGTI